MLGESESPKAGFRACGAPILRARSVNRALSRRNNKWGAMYIIVDDRNIVTGGYASSFDREGVTTTGIDPMEFSEWLSKASESDVEAVEAFLIGDCLGREHLPRLIRERSKAPVLCLRERPSLDDTLGLFAAGVDDVVRKPVHVREILARVGAIARRNLAESRDVTIGELTVYFDGREVEARGESLPLPRRERRILECLVRNRGRRLSKTQIFNAVYGIFDEDVDENVVESHISKLRKKLKPGSATIPSIPSASLAIA
jgi:two-component system, OmpR family, flagellar system response regulator FtcR